MFKLLFKTDLNDLLFQREKTLCERGRVQVTELCSIFHNVLVDFLDTKYTLDIKC